MAGDPGAGFRAIGNQHRWQKICQTTRKCCCALQFPLQSDGGCPQLVDGPVAQLGARLTGSQEVAGSNPARSTT